MVRETVIYVQATCGIVVGETCGILSCLHVAYQLPMQYYSV